MIARIRTRLPRAADEEENDSMSHESRAAQPDGEPAQPSKPLKKRGNDEERRFERGVAIRAGFYIFGTHLFAGFVWLLFYLGEHAHK